MCLFVREPVNGGAYLRELMQDAVGQDVFLAVCLGNQESLTGPFSRTIGLMRAS